MNHIHSVTEANISWCGEPIGPIDFHFKTLDQAALAGLFPDMKKPCEECINESVRALLNNLGTDND